MPLVYAPMYTQIYRATIDTMPGMFFLVGGALTIPSVVIFFWMYIVSKNEEKAVENFQQNSPEKEPKTEISSETGKPKVTFSATETNGDLKRANRSFSLKRNSITRASLGMINAAFVADEAVEIVKELPAFHLEHCKL